MTANSSRFAANAYDESAKIAVHHTEKITKITKW